MNAILSDTLILRTETAADYSRVEWLTREAFWNHHVPGCDEHYLAHTMRDAEDFIPELDYVAVLDGEIVGNIMYARSRIVDEEGVSLEVLTFGPVSVLPALQNKGIGSALINHTLELARKRGHRILMTYGDPLYYARFGFVGGESYGVRGKEGYFSPALIVLELVPGAMKGVSGRFIESDAYTLDPAAAEEYDKLFEPKEKLVTASQQRFQDLLAQEHL